MTTTSSVDGTKHLLVGDGHYRGRPEELERWQALVARVRADRIDAFSILGDFFELWLAVEGVMPSWQHAMLEPLRALKASGVTLRYVIGNKDYFVDEWNKNAKLFDDVIDGTSIVQSPSGPLHLAHGDLVNQSDTQYLRWRAFSRSWPVRTFARSLPKRWLRNLGSTLAQSLEGTNRAHKIYYPADELEARARELRAGPATQIYGHFHVHRELLFGDKRVITLPFLATENAGVLVDAGGFHRFEA